MFDICHPIIARHAVSRGRRLFYWDQNDVICVPGHLLVFQVDPVRYYVFFPLVIVILFVIFIAAFLLFCFRIGTTVIL